ncbi:Transthyretin-like family protein [Ancylostoma caninum]|uniref:Transthyretin-like family protein n=1 Tax=Ancylostoma caninum TaxID=29170 RepID=A0A368GFE1_ANCCA|nr:Transthyretin-like family protein [Ancylostoma caninum]
MTTCSDQSQQTIEEFSVFVVLPQSVSQNRIQVICRSFKILKVTDIEPYIYIEHNCGYEGLDQKHYFIRAVPKEFIMEGNFSKKTYHMGDIELLTKDAPVQQYQRRMLIHHHHSSHGPLSLHQQVMQCIPHYVAYKDYYEKVVVSGGTSQYNKTELEKQAWDDLVRKITGPPPSPPGISHVEEVHTQTRLEEQRRLDEMKRLEEERRLEEQRRLEEEKRKEDEPRKDDLTEAEEDRELEEEARLREQHWKDEEERRRLEEERRRLEEELEHRREEHNRRLEEFKKLEEQRKEEIARLEQERKMWMEKLKELEEGQKKKHLVQIICSRDNVVRTTQIREYTEGEDPCEGFRRT